MDNLANYIIAGVISFLFDLLLKRYEPKSRLIIWRTHSFEYNLPLISTPENPNPPDTKIPIYIQGARIDNLGRKPVDDIEIIHKERPDFFVIDPAQPYEERNTPTGEHVIFLPHLAPKSGFSIQYFCHLRYPVMTLARCKQGLAEVVPVRPQIIRPQWTVNLLRFLIFLGTATAIFWLMKLIVYLTSLLKTGNPI